MHQNKALLKDIIWKFNPIASKSLELIEDEVEYRTVEKGTTFIKIDRRNDYEYFLLDGICRSYLLNPEGEEITISFFIEQSVLSPYVTRTLNGISLLNFQALTDLQLARINATDFQNMMVDHLDVREMGNRVLQRELLQKVQKEIGLASLTAKERLIKFREQFPLLENLIPHPVIASYLGITNISLSRLRKELSIGK